jgi:hypothetical protein
MCATQSAEAIPAMVSHSQSADPPRAARSSASTTRAPARAAANAADKPAGPPPTTSTSQWAYSNA